MSLLVVGGTTVDIILPRLSRLPSWPKHSEFTAGNLVMLAQAPICTLGGNGANAAYVASRRGATVDLHTQIGDDSFGSLARAWLEESGCQVISPRHSQTAINITAANSRHQRATFFYPGKPAFLPTFSARKPNKISHLLIGGWPHPPLAALASGLQKAHQRGAFTSLDIGPILTQRFRLATLKPVLGELDLFLANEYELQKVTGVNILANALTKLRSCFSGDVVIKRGGEGALWIPKESNQPVRFASPRVHVVNTVGAGDSFNGALLAALARGSEFGAAIREACMVAAGVVNSGRGVLGVKPLHSSMRRSPQVSS